MGIKITFKIENLITPSIQLPIEGNKLGSYQIAVELNPLIKNKEIQIPKLVDIIQKSAKQMCESKVSTLPDTFSLQFEINKDRKNCTYVVNSRPEYELLSDLNGKRYFAQIISNEISDGYNTVFPTVLDKFLQFFLSFFASLGTFTPTYTMAPHSYKF